MSSKNPKRGEIWNIDFDPAKGSEVKKKRPAVVMNVTRAGRLPLRIVVPITTGKSHFERYFWMVKLKHSKANGLSNDSFADTFQVKSVSTNRFKDKRGIITQQQMQNITAAIVLCIGHVPPKSKDDNTTET